MDEGADLTEEEEGHIASFSDQVVTIYTAEGWNNAPYYTLF